MYRDDEAAGRARVAALSRALARRQGAAADARAIDAEVAALDGAEVFARAAELERALAEPTSRRFATALPKVTWPWLASGLLLSGVTFLFLYSALVWLLRGTF